MATPPSKRYCKASEDSSDDSSDFEPIFPSDDEDEPEDPADHYVFPSENSNQTVVNMNGSYMNDECLSISSLSNSETENESENEDDVGVELKTVGNILVSFCCKKYCLRHLTVMDAINSRKEMFLNKNKADQKRWLHQKLTDSSSQSNTDGTIDTTYSVAGKKVCPMAWCKVYSLSERTLRRLHRKITFCDSLSHGNSGKKRQNTLTETTAAWMGRYFFLVGDKMPDKNQVHLPCWETRKDVYHRYCSDMQSTTGNVLQLSMFYKLWKRKFSNVMIPEVSA